MKKLILKIKNLFSTKKIKNKSDVEIAIELATKILKLNLKTKNNIVQSKIREVLALLNEELKGRQPTDEEITKKFSYNMKDKKFLSDFEKMKQGAFDRVEETRKQHKRLIDVDNRILNSNSYKEFVFKKAKKYPSNSKVFVHSTNEIITLKERIENGDFVDVSSQENIKEGSTLTDLQVKKDSALKGFESLLLTKIDQDTKAYTYVINSIKNVVVERGDIKLLFEYYSNKKRVTIGEIKIIYQDEYIVKINEKEKQNKLNTEQIIKFISFIKDVDCSKPEELWDCEMSVNMREDIKNSDLSQKSKEESKKQILNIIDNKKFCCCNSKKRKNL